MRALQVPTLIVGADADLAPPSHYVEAFKLLDGGLRDAGWAGDGILETRPGGYQPIGDNPPKRPRSRPSPLDRDAWLASLSRRT